MATHTAVPEHIRVGAGVLLWAPLGTAEPAVTATAGKFGTTFTGWTPVGATEDGHTFNYQEQTADLTPEEAYYPEMIATTGVTADMTFSMWYQSPDNWQLAFNGGTATSAGSADAAVTTFAPPVIGAAVNRMLLWQSDDDAERVVVRSVRNTAQIGMPRRKAPNKVLLPVTFRILQPAGAGAPWNRYTADALFGAPGDGA